jgi:surface antigen
VPANRYVDGFPAYAQCSAFQAGAIYSNNGIDTSATKQGADWVQTQRDGGYQCTELIHRYWHFKWNVTWLPRGNAGTWCDTQPPATSGVVQTTTPVHGDALVLAPGSCGASATFGHVALVDTVDNAGAKVSVIEQNQARRGTYMQSCAKCFLHLVANDGSDAGTAAKPAPGDAGAGAPVPPLQPDAGRPARADAGLPASDAGQGPAQPTVDAQTGTQVPVTDAAIRDAGVAVADASGGDAAAVAPGALQPEPEDDSEGGCSVQAGKGQTAAAWQLLSALCGLLLLTRRASGAHSRRQR